MPEKMCKKKHLTSFQLIILGCEVHTGRYRRDSEGRDER